MLKDRGLESRFGLLFDVGLSYSDHVSMISKRLYL